MDEECTWLEVQNRTLFKNIFLDSSNELKRNPVNHLFVCLNVEQEIALKWIPTHSICEPKQSKQKQKETWALVLEYKMNGDFGLLQNPVSSCFVSTFNSLQIGEDLITYIIRNLMYSAMGTIYYLSRKQLIGQAFR